MNFLIRTICLTVILLGCTTCGSVAQDLTNPVEAGRSALKKTRAPWYDVETDDVHIVAKRKTTAADDRQDWQQKSKRPEWSIDWNWDWSWDWSGWSWGGGGPGGPGFFGWLSSLSWGQIIWYSLLLVLVFVVMIAVAYFLSRFVSNLRQEISEVVVEAEVRTDEERIENLPIQPTTRKGDFLSMAESCYQSGNYGEAIVYLFSHRLLQLDRAGHIRLTRGKTNRQYLYEVTDSTRLQSILGQTIVRFEDVFFGKHPLSKEGFEKTWQANAEFDSIIKQALS